MLSELAEAVPGARLEGEDLAVTGLAEDSRKVQQADLFVAARGRTVDGHDFAQEAVSRGAAAVVAERWLDLGVPVIVVADAARSVGPLAAAFWGHPAESLTMVAVTGTNGKTTTCSLLESILTEQGARPGVIGTVSYRYCGRVEPAPYTTPTAWLLHSMLAKMVEAGCTHGIMEVSSHALDMGRVEGLTFDVAAFTNLTQDHLDLHGTMDAYFAAKQTLFRDHLDPDGVAVAWADDPMAAQMVGAFSGMSLCCSATDRQADIHVETLKESLSGFSARVVTPRGAIEVQSKMLGRTNVANSLVAVGLALGLGIPPDVIGPGLSRCDRVPGRLEPVHHVQPGRPTVLVDYAHTPDAIEKVLATLRPLTKGRLMIVFGCGGDRDQTKRPLMGKAAAKGADLVVVTSDNPRTEDPGAIIDMALEGVVATGMEHLDAERFGQADTGYVVQPDRGSAITLAIEAARDGDVVLIAGKGHEDYQILGHDRIHFDDREQALALLEALESRKAGGDR